MFTIGAFPDLLVRLIDLLLGTKCKRYHTKFGSEMDSDFKIIKADKLSDKMFFH